MENQTLQASSQLGFLSACPAEEVTISVTWYHIMPQPTSHESLAHAANRGIGTEPCLSSGKDIPRNGTHIIYGVPAVYQVPCETWDPGSLWHFRSSGERESGNTKSSCDVPSAFVGKMQVARGIFYTGR